jgi:hypothetical protein
MLAALGASQGAHSPPCDPVDQRRTEEDQQDNSGSEGDADDQTKEGYRECDGEGNEPPSPRASESLAERDDTLGRHRAWIFGTATIFAFQ